MFADVHSSNWSRSWLTAISIVILSLLTVDTAYAVPSMARQTGMECSACHTVFPELTPFGRQFKLRGFTLGTALDNKRFPSNLPLAGVAQVSQTNTDRRAAPSTEGFVRDRELIAQAVGLYWGGKLSPHIGALIQYNYDGVEKAAAVEMVDIRFARTATWLGKGVVWGATLNNAPTLSDLYNSTSMWSFPHVESASIKAPGALIEMDLAAQVGGVGVFALWNDRLYVEAAGYRTAAQGVFRPLSAGVRIDRRVVGTAPYWRVALQRESGNHHIEGGAFGLHADVGADADDATGVTDRFDDVGVDVQYQYLSEPIILTATAAWVDERQSLAASSALEMVDRAESTLRSFRANAHLSYRRRWALGLGYVDVVGSTDELRFNSGEAVTGSIRAVPDHREWIAELAYLPRQNLKLLIRRTTFQQFNGSSRDYDGFGRDAADNSSWYALAWYAL